MIDLKDVITKYPESIEFAARFRAYMADLYPERADQARIKVLADVISCGIVDEIKAGNTDSLSISRYRKLMEDRYGYSSRLVAESIAKWVQAYAPDAVSEKQTQIKPKPAPKAFANEKMHVHRFEDIIVPATCRERGYTLHRCKCGYEHSDKFIPVGDHHYEVVDEITPTCKEEGRRDYLCSVCSKYKTETIPKTTHRFSAWKTVQKAGCGVEGRKERHCLTCAKTESEIIPALQHEWTDWVDNIFATCTESGKKTRQCKHCKEIEEKIVKATGHAFSRWKTSTTQKDIMERFCKNCGKTEYRDIVEERRKKEETERKKREEEERKEREAEEHRKNKEEEFRKISDEKCRQLEKIRGVLEDEVLAKKEYLSKLWLFKNKEKKDVQEEIAELEKKIAAVVKIAERNEMTFGGYIQFSNSLQIDWEILAAENGRLLLVSKYAIDCKPYNTEEKEVTWKSCTLRKWLNNDFFNAAFSKEEKEMIQTTTISDDRKSEKDIDSNDTTDDKIFLLSISEAEKYFISDYSRRCMPTKYAKAAGVWTMDQRPNRIKNSFFDIFFDNYEDKCTWWLRSTYKKSRHTVVVDVVAADGAVNEYGGSQVDSSENGVRPAMWIKFIDMPR